MAEKKNICGCGCTSSKKGSEKQANDKKDAKKSK